MLLPATTAPPQVLDWYDSPEGQLDDQEVEVEPVGKLYPTPYAYWTSFPLTLYEFGADETVPSKEEPKVTLSETSST
jgi:hypothetical protein